MGGVPKRAAWDYDPNSLENVERAFHRAADIIEMYLDERADEANALLTLIGPEERWSVATAAFALAATALREHAGPDEARAWLESYRDSVR